MANDILNLNSLIAMFYNLETNEDFKSLQKNVLIMLDSTESLEKRLISLLRVWKRMPFELKVATAGALGLSLALVKVINYASEGDNIEGLARQARLATDKFQSLANATKQYGGTAEGVAQSISILGDNIANLKKGGDGNGLKETLEAFKINPEGIQSVEQFLDVVSAKMAMLATETEKIDFGRALGLDDATIQVLINGLQQYNEELSNSSKYNIFSEKDLERSKELQETLINIGMGFKVIGDVISGLLLPIIIPVFKGIQKVTDFFARNVEMLKLGIVELAGAIAVALVSLIAQVSPILGALIPLVVTFIASMWPIFVITGGVIALNYALGQLWAWISGKPSMFDKWLGSFETFKEGVISGLKQLKHKWITIFMEMWDKMPALLKFFFKNLTFPGLLVQGVMAVKGFQNRKKRKSATAAAGLDYVPYDGYVAELHKGESVLTKSESNVWRDLMFGKDAIAATANIPLASIPQGAIAGAYSNSTTTKNFTIGDITIQTQATDAEGIASDLLQNIKMAFNGLDTGVRA